MLFARMLSAAVLVAAAAAACAPAGETDQAEQPPAAETAEPAAPEAPPPPPADPLAVGAQEAKDALYCAALIFAAHPAPTSAQSPTDQARRVKAENLAIAIGDEGINQLIQAGQAHATHAATIMDAYSAQAAADLEAGAPRITVEDCIARAEALPPLQ
jgi:hypothetical protein